MSEISYVTGSVVYPQGAGKKIIAHVCNNAGTWAGGVTKALGKAWPRARIAYKAWYKELGYRLALGTTQLVERPGEDILIANMIAQPGIKWSPVQPQSVNYTALAQCLQTVAGRARFFRASVHMPRIHDWVKVEPLVLQALAAQDTPVFVYDEDA